MNSATINSSKLVANANSAPAATAGAISGSTTRPSTTWNGAPRLVAARNKLRSKPCSEASTVTTT